MQLISTISAAKFSVNINNQMVTVTNHSEIKTSYGVYETKILEYSGA
jgi:hypothetical protein